VTFKTIDEAAIEAYLAKVHTLDKAGGYAIQEQPELIIASRTGSLTNIVGLPVDTVKQILTRCGLLKSSS
jgi:septum formation protein